MRFATFFMMILIGVFTLGAPKSAAGEEIYRWVDEKGVVHFGDRAPEQGDAEKISIPQSDGVSAQSSTDSDSPGGEEAQEPQTSYAQQLRDERAEARRERQAKAEAIAESCTKAREAVTQLEPSPRVNVVHEDGTVSRMDDNDRLEALAKAQAYIAEHCNN